MDAQAPIRLTQMASCAGCAAKLNPEKLAELLAPLQETFLPNNYPDLLHGLSQPDDAAVWSLDDERALVVTTDFFTPVVDDPYDFGAIAAANAISDLYAMGARPFLALNILGIPNDLDLKVGAAILRGGAEKAKEAGMVVAGGHTIQDPEPKFGLIALGMLDKEKVIRKDGARVGDQLFLSKPLGFGATNTATKRELSSTAEQQEVVAWMAKLNRDAAELALKYEVQGGTDVTGFGLLGHAWEMAASSRVGIQIDYDQLSFTSAALKFARDFVFPAGSIDNRTYFEKHVEVAENIGENESMLLYDAQTSGGLLLAVEKERAADFLDEAQSNNIAMWRIGSVFEAEPKISIV